MLNGLLIAESLRLDGALEVAGVSMTRVYRRDVSGSATETQPATWTYVEFAAEDDRAEELAAALSRSLLAEGGWYADFTAGDERVLVFADRIFRYPRGDADGRAQAQAYGASVGVPPRQLDWTE